MVLKEAVADSNERQVREVVAATICGGRQIVIDTFITPVSGNCYYYYGGGDYQPIHKATRDIVIHNSQLLTPSNSNFRFFRGKNFNFIPTILWKVSTIFHIKVGVAMKSFVSLLSDTRKTEVGGFQL